MKILEALEEKIAKNKEVLFKVKVFPGAHENSAKEGKDKMLHVKVTAVPENGKANQAVVKIIATMLKLRKYQVNIVSGLKEKIKTIKISR